MNIGRAISFLSEKRFGNNIFQDFFLHRSERNKKGNTNLLGKKVHYIDGRNYITGRREIFRDETYKISSNSSEEKLIIDCGSNIGLSIIYLNNILSNTRFIAFEPDQNNFIALEKNMTIFGIKKIELHKAAVWISDDHVNFSTGGTMDSRISDHSIGQEVPAVSLNNLLKSKEKVFFLKMDIEGAENFVIENSKNQLSKCEYIFVEYHSINGNEQKLNTILKILMDAGFRYHIKEANASRYPYLSHYDKNDMEFQLNIFCYKS